MNLRPLTYYIQYIDGSYVSGQTNGKPEYTIDKSKAAPFSNHQWASQYITVFLFNNKEDYKIVK